MKIIKTIPSLKKTIQSIKFQNKKVGFVPTMGALHRGHLSLISKCRRENDITVLSIFVNPIQFGPNEDFAKYPRQEKKDKLLAQKEKVDIIFYPSKEMMYPSRFLTKVEVEGITNILCGKSREGHFRGVTTVVCKLLHLVEPDTLYLGQKDYQQAVVLKQMVEDLNFNVHVKICPTVREKDGLALSSRNIYLSNQERKEAPVLYRSLKESKVKAEINGYGPSKAIALIRKMITAQSSAKIEYVECLDALTLRNIQSFSQKAVMALAVKFGETRLIDNIIIKGNEKTKKQT